VRPRFGNFAAAWAFPFLVTRGECPCRTKRSRSRKTLPQQCHRKAQGAVRAAEKADLTKAATEAGDEDDEEDQIAREDAMTRPSRKT